MSPARIRAGLAALATLVLGAPAAVLAAHPFNVTLRDAQGNAITSSSTVPYSPERSCGSCHDVALITQGYHFQQGRTNGAAQIQVSDAFAGSLGYDPVTGNPLKGTGAWWKLSDGMYGKW